MNSSESSLSHRGLMKLANAKLDYAIELNQLEGFIRMNGDTQDTRRYREGVISKYKLRVRQIYDEDKRINCN